MSALLRILAVGRCPSCGASSLPSGVSALYLLSVSSALQLCQAGVPHSLGVASHIRSFLPQPSTPVFPNTLFFASLSLTALGVYLFPGSSWQEQLQACLIWQLRCITCLKTKWIISESNDLTPRKDVSSGGTSDTTVGCSSSQFALPKFLSPPLSYI